MERRALLTALALTIPLAMYGIPYAYAATTSPSTYVVVQAVTVPPGSTSSPSSVTSVIPCNTGDYATGGGWLLGNAPPVEPYNAPTQGGSAVTTTGTRPDGWEVAFENTNAVTYAGYAYAVCEANFTIAGIGVPQFGSLYVAIALGAVVYFVLARRFTGRPTISTPAQQEGGRADGSTLLSAGSGSATA